MVIVSDTTNATRVLAGVFNFVKTVVLVTVGYFIRVSDRVITAGVNYINQARHITIIVSILKVDLMVVKPKAVSLRYRDMDMINDNFNPKDFVEDIGKVAYASLAKVISAVSPSLTLVNLCISMDISNLKSFTTNSVLSIKLI